LAEVLYVFGENQIISTRDVHESLRLLVEVLVILISMSFAPARNVFEGICEVADPGWDFLFLYLIPLV